MHVNHKIKHFDSEMISHNIYIMRKICLEQALMSLLNDAKVVVSLDY